MRFGQSNNLQKHMKIVHAGGHSTDVPSFKCAVCNMAFEGMKPLKKHVRAAHNQFKCDECEEVFTVRASLRRHTRVIHLGEQAYACPVCDMRFGQSGCLRRHEKNVHASVGRMGERANVCPECDKRFGQAYNLRRHQENVHKVTSRAEQPEIPFGAVPIKIVVEPAHAKLVVSGQHDTLLATSNAADAHRCHTFSSDWGPV
ncbi:unnamed protein product [Sphagnum balticum]